MDLNWRWCCDCAEGAFPSGVESNISIHNPIAKEVLEIRDQSGERRLGL
jgi:hypothetical protein